jgi:predicted Zn-dependent peptidase
VAAGVATATRVREHHLTTLENGVRVASERMPGLRSVALGVFVGVGSRDEAPADAGISHFIEHLLFRGTDRHDALEIAQTFDRFGAELNAATSREFTEIYARVIDTHLPEALAIVGGMVRAPSFLDIDPEREVVIEEIAMYEDAPDDLVHDMIGEAVFPGDPLGRPVIGRADVIERLSVADVGRYHGRYYAPGNIVVAAAGSIDHDALAAMIDAELGGLAAPAPTPAPDVAIDAGVRRVFLEKDTEQYHLCLGAPGVSRHDDRRFAASLLDQILGGGASSRLFQEIRERRGMAYSVYSYGSTYRETGQVGVYVGTREENLEECLEVTATEIAALTAGRFADDEVERAKDAMKGRLALAMESTSSRMVRLGKGILTGLELLDEDEIGERVDRVTPDDLAALAGELFAPDRLSAACIGPDAAVFDRALGTFSAGAA